MICQACRLGSTVTLRVRGLETIMADGPSEQRLRRRRRGGRPSLPAERRRMAALPPVRLTTAELAAVAAEAGSCGLARGDMVRRRLLGRRLPRAGPRLNPEGW